MTFFLSKFLLFIIRPLVWIIVLALYACFTKRKVRRRNACISAVVVLLLLSNNYLLGTVADWYEPKATPLGHYDVGLLLGGFSSYNEEMKSLKSEVSGDRLTQTIKLYHQGIIDRILMSGGDGSLSRKNLPEASYTRDYLQAIQIPDSAVIVETKSRNTKENFIYAARILKDLKKSNPKILVITSAWHIPRAKLQAESQGLENITYYPTSSLTSSYSMEDYLLPQARALLGWEFLIKEWVGYLTTKFGMT